MSNPLDLITGKAAAWALLVLLTISVGLGVSQYIRANAAEKSLDTCRKSEARQAGQIDAQNESMRLAKRAADAVRADAERLIAEAEQKAEKDAGKIAALQARIRTGGGSKTCTDALQEIRQGWKAAP